MTTTNNPWKVQLFKLNFDHREVESVRDVIESGWITMGDKTREFERKFSEFLADGIAATAVSNGTAALHMALLASGMGPGRNIKGRNAGRPGSGSTGKAQRCKCTAKGDWLDEGPGGRGRPKP